MNNWANRSITNSSIFILLLFAGPFSSFASEPFREKMAAEEMKQTMQALYAFDFLRADSLSTEMLRKFPGHYLSHFSRSQYLWWLIITQPENPELENQYYQTLAQSLSAIQEYMGPARTHEQTFYFINIYAMQARLFLKKKEYLRTIISLRNCISEIEASLGRESDYPPFNLSSGMYNYMSEYAIKKFPFLTLYTLLYPKGNMALGMEQLKAASLSDHLVWKTEATYLLMKIYLELEPKPALAIPLASQLTETYPQNLIYQWHYLQALESIQATEESILLKTELRKITRNAPGINSQQRAYFLSLFSQ